MQTSRQLGELRRTFSKAHRSSLPRNLFVFSTFWILANAPCCDGLTQARALVRRLRIYIHALLVAKCSRGERRGLKKRGIEAWQKVRQERVDSVMALTKKLNNTRLLEVEKAKLGEDDAWTSKMDEHLGWLHHTRMEEQIAGLS